MKTTVSLLLLVCLVGLSLFAFWSMSHSMSSGHATACLGATTQGLACPEGATTLEFVNFHLNGFRQATLAMSANGYFGLVLLLLFLCSLLWLTPPFYKYLHLPLFFRPAYQLIYQAEPRPAALTHWLALHETSPTDR